MLVVLDCMQWGGERGSVGGSGCQARITTNILPCNNVYQGNSIKFELSKSNGSEVSSELQTTVASRLDGKTTVEKAIYSGIYCRLVFVLQGGLLFLCLIQRNKKVQTLAKNSTIIRSGA